MTFSTPNTANKVSLEILDKIKVDIEIRENPFQLPLESLFEMGARINKKRSFLFVSKVLGKHLAVSPKVPLLAGAALAAQYMEQVHGAVHPAKQELKEAIVAGEAGELLLEAVQQHSFTLPDPAVFIGFAETATALGHAMFNSFGNARFLHTTREEVEELRSAINFEEEHSHATSHRCYAGTEFFDHPYPIILVDDESTTGKTALNIIESIQEVFPRREYAIVTLLDWRTDEHREAFREAEKVHGIVIREISLLSGSMRAEGDSIEEVPEAEPNRLSAGESQVFAHTLEAGSGYETEWSSKGDPSAAPHYLSVTGRFGMDSAMQEKAGSFISRAAAELTGKRKGSRTLCLGTGEFMYIPMRIASEMGEGILYHSTTRSPIHSVRKKGYPISSKFSYPSPEHRDVRHFFYNVEPGMYDEVFVFMEREALEEDLQPMLAHLTSAVPIVQLVYFCRRKGDSHAS